MGKREDDRAVQEGPAITEQQWRIASITSAILAGVAVIFGYLWIFADGFDGEHDQRLAQTLAPFGVALFALVTFCAASWRGSINTRQADQSENEGRAKLLQEGAKLLAEDDKPAHLSAGIASLGVLVSGSNKDYAFHAMNLLADFVEDHMASNHRNRHRPQIAGVMLRGERNGVSTGRHVYFDCIDDDPDSNDAGEYEDVDWHYIPGFTLIKYRGGVFGHDVHYELDKLKNVSFSRVDIEDWNPVNIDDRFYRCRFARCGIASFDSLLSIPTSSELRFAFSQCDFSGCLVREPGLLSRNLKQNRNFYLSGNPPKLIGGEEGIDWSEVLLCVDEKAYFRSRHGMTWSRR